jgi:hypothetical protein
LTGRTHFGTPKIGGLTIWQALEIIRGCRGLNIVACGLVEISPPYDPSGNTALVGANLLYEMLCMLPKVKYRTKAVSFDYWPRLAMHARHANTRKNQR